MQQLHRLVNMAQMVHTTQEQLVTSLYTRARVYKVALVRYRIFSSTAITYILKRAQPRRVQLGSTLSLVQFRQHRTLSARGGEFFQSAAAVFVPPARPRRTHTHNGAEMSGKDIKARHQKAGLLYKLPMSKCVLHGKRGSLCGTAAVNRPS